MVRRCVVVTLLLVVPLAGLAGCKDSSKPAKVPEPIPAQRFPQKK